jgi:hypothetical protein
MQQAHLRHLQEHVAQRAGELFTLKPHGMPGRHLPSSPLQLAQQ